MHKYTFPPRKLGACVWCLRWSRGVWVVRASPPRLRKASKGEAESQSCGQRARVVRNTQDCRIPPLSLSWNMTPLLASYSLSSTAQQQTPTHRWDYRGQAARQRLLTLWFPLGGNASIIDDLVLKFCAQTGVVKKLRAQKHDVSQKQLPHGLSPLKHSNSKMKTFHTQSLCGASGNLLDTFLPNS